MPRRPARSDAPVPRGGSPGPQAALLARLKAAEGALRAIQSGEVDALMVSGRRGRQVVSLTGGEPAYRLLVEAMSEGAATLSRDGAVLYCNGRFAELVRRPRVRLIGIGVQSLVAKSERERFDAFLAQARRAAAKGEFNLRRRDGSTVPVYVSLDRFRPYHGQALGMVVTDLSDQKRQQAADIEQARAMHRLLLERTFSAQEEERRRIARELHDEAGQSLTALLVGLRTIEHARNLVEVAALGQRLRAVAAHAIGEVGRLARGLHPTVLDDHGLSVAVSRYVAEYATTHNISVDLALDDHESLSLPLPVRTALYRILQEALTNVARHSGATAVRVRLTRSATAVELTVVDDGCGFDARAVAVSSHRLGIQGMRERAAMLGGTVSFKSRRKGTAVLVHLPLPGQNVQPSKGRRNT
jgi:PAS domain S-box-containing protein